MDIEAHPVYLDYIELCEILFQNWRQGVSATPWLQAIELL